MKRPRSVARTHGKRLPIARVVVCTEGAVSEIEYLKEFCRTCVSQHVRLVPIPVGREPRAVVEEAIREKSRVARDSLADRDSFWAMFDRDAHLRFAEAKDLARGNRIHLAVSDPCFELWGVLHYQDQDGPIERHECQRKLETLCDGYSRREGKVFNDLTAITENYVDAVRRAERLLVRREEEGIPEGNPSSTVHLLTEHIRNFDDA